MARRGEQVWGEGRSLLLRRRRFSLRRMGMEELMSMGTHQCLLRARCLVGWDIITSRRLGVILIPMVDAVCILFFSFVVEVLFLNSLRIIF